MSYSKVEATAEELATWARKHPNRPTPSVDRVQCDGCGTRIWGSGLARGSHGKACGNFVSAAELLTMIEERQGSLAGTHGDGFIAPKNAHAALLGLWNAGRIVPGSKLAHGYAFGWYSVRMIDAAHEEALTMDAERTEALRALARRRATLGYDAADL